MTARTRQRIAELRLQTKKDGKTYMTFHLDGNVKKLGLFKSTRMISFNADMKKLTVKFAMPELIEHHEVSPTDKAHLANVANTIAASLNKGHDDDKTA
jgi:hypothetical protein